MNTAVLDFTDTEPPMGDPLNHPVVKRQSWKHKIFIAILAIGTIWGVIVTTQISTAMQRANELEVANAKLRGDNKDLAAKVASLPALQKGLADTKRSLGIEIAEKNRLAVLLTRAEAGRKQAVADHAVALGRIAALEQAGKKAQPKRK